MRNELKVEKKINWDIIVFIIGCLLYVISCFSIFSIKVIEATIVCGIICFIGWICWIFVNHVLKNFLKSGEEGRRVGLLETKEKISCIEDDSVLCPLNEGFDEDGINFKINRTTSEINRLYERDTVYEEIENNDKREKPWKDIWIFSQNLSSEIINDSAEDVVVTNIKSYKTRYTFFYLNRKDQKEQDEIDYRREIIENSIPEEYRGCLSFEPIDVSGCLGKNTLPLLCGSILFSLGHNRALLPNFIEGYLSIRKDKNDIPIYYKMPRCMLREYANFFRTIYSKNNKNKGGQP